MNESASKVKYTRSFEPMLVSNSINQMVISLSLFLFLSLSISFSSSLFLSRERSVKQKHCISKINNKSEYSQRKNCNEWNKQTKKGIE